MPNHVRNVWKIKGIAPKDIDYILNKLATKYKPVSSDRPEYIIDFDLIIPEPRFKKDCPKDCIVNRKSCIEEDKVRPWFDWYTYHVKYWGTKWGAYDGYTKIGKTCLTFVFNTAWSFPSPIAGMLENLGYELELRFADEDIGSNCGKFIFNPAEEEEGKRWTITTEKDMDNPDGFANYLWTHY